MWFNGYIVVKETGYGAAVVDPENRWNNKRPCRGLEFTNSIGFYDCTSIDRIKPFAERDDNYKPMLIWL
jgi:hypothetical protein